MGNKGSKKKHSDGERGEYFPIYESCNVIFCIRKYHEHFPLDCFRMIMSFINECEFCLNPTIENHVHHEKCFSISSLFFRCLVCGMEISKSEKTMFENDEKFDCSFLLVHEKCASKAKLFWERMILLERNYDFEVNSKKRIKCYCYYLLNHLEKKRGDPTSIDPKKLITGTCEINRKYDPRILKEKKLGHQNIYVEKKELRYPIITIRRSEGGTELVIKPIYEVKLEIIEGNIFLIVTTFSNDSFEENRKSDTSTLLFFRIDHLSKILRLLCHTIEIGKDDGIVMSEKLLTSKFSTHLHSIDKSVHENQKKRDLRCFRKTLREKCLTKEGFFISFFQIHGLFGEQTSDDKFRPSIIADTFHKNDGHEFSDLFFMRTKFFNKSNFTSPYCEFLKKFDQARFWISHRISPCFHEGRIEGVRPRNSFFSRRWPFDRYGVKQPIIHMSMVIVDSDIHCHAYHSSISKNDFLNRIKQNDNWEEEMFVKPMIYFDGCYFDWNEAEIIVPIKSFHPLFFWDDQHLLGFKNMEETEVEGSTTAMKNLFWAKSEFSMMKHLRAAEIVHKYNMYAKFKEVKPKRNIIEHNSHQCERNNMDFCRDFCFHVGSPKVRNGLRPIFSSQHVFREFHKKGKSLPCISFNDKVTDFFNLPQGLVIYFHTHEELDDFVNFDLHKLGEKYGKKKKTEEEGDLKEKSDLKFPDLIQETVILKAFDRCFWTRKYLFPEIKKYWPSRKKPIFTKGCNNDGEYCPFGNPSGGGRNPKDHFY